MRYIIVAITLYLFTCYPIKAKAELAPLSTELAKCAAFFMTMNDEQSEQFANDFLLLTYAQALRERLPQSESHVDDLVRGFVLDWRKRGKNFDPNEPGRDWVEYCLNLGRAQGVNY